MTYRLKHPSVLHGALALSWRKKALQVDLDNGVIEITEAMGGEALAKHLIQTEKFEDLTNYAKPSQAQTPKGETMEEYGFELLVQNANDANKINGTIAFRMNGKEESLAVIQNIVYVQDRATAEVLIRDGLKLVRILTRKPKK